MQFEQYFLKIFGTILSIIESLSLISNSGIEGRKTRLHLIFHDISSALLSSLFIPHLLQLETTLCENMSRKHADLNKCRHIVAICCIISNLYHMTSAFSID